MNIKSEYTANVEMNKAANTMQHFSSIDRHVKHNNAVRVVKVRNSVTLGTLVKWCAVCTVIGTTLAFIF